LPTIFYHKKEEDNIYPRLHVNIMSPSYDLNDFIRYTNKTVNLIGEGDPYWTYPTIISLVKYYYSH